MMDHSLGTTDAQAMETTVAEAPQRFEDFFHAEHARLFGALCFATGVRHEAEEIMQDAFLRMWERWDEGRFDDPSAHLFRTAMNVFRNRYRRSVLGLRKTRRCSANASTVRTLATRGRAAIREKAGDAR